MTPEELQKRRDYKAAWARRHRAAAKDKLGTVTNLDTEHKPSHAVQAASDTPTAPMTPPTPRNPPQTKHAKSGKPKSDRAQRREYRATLAEYLEDCLTDPSAPMSGELYERCRMTAFWMGCVKKLHQLEASVDGKPDLLSEMRLSIAVECLRRLTGETPARSAQALPHKAA